MVRGRLNKHPSLVKTAPIPTHCVSRLIAIMIAFRSHFVFALIAAVAIRRRLSRQLHVYLCILAQRVDDNIITRRLRPSPKAFVKRNHRIALFLHLR